jgi:membrane protease YdiL (CAAX protease family)
MAIKVLPKVYLERSSSLLYSYIVVLPLFLLYELLIYIGQPSDQQVRISVDIWLKSLISHTGFDLLTVTFLLVLVIGLVILIMERKRLKELHLSTFLWMHVESIIYAMIMAAGVGFVIQGLFGLLQGGAEATSLSLVDQFALSLGAGLYEELFFRVILVGLLYFFFKAFFAKEWVAAIISAVIGALIFSAVHYMGNMGDVFTWHSFAFRALAGLVLNGLYVLRGFGIAATTHAWYDVIVLLIL